MALIYHRRDDYDMALEWYVRAYRVLFAKLGRAHPHTQRVYNDLSQAHTDSGNKIDFQEWLEKKLSEEPSVGKIE